MQSTGQTSTQALSFTLMHGSAMIYAIEAFLANRSPGEILRRAATQFYAQKAEKPHYFYPKPSVPIFTVCWAEAGAARGPLVKMRTAAS